MTPAVTAAKRAGIDFEAPRFRRLATTGSGDAEVSIADGYRLVLVGEAAEESARIGAPVDLRGRGP